MGLGAHGMCVSVYVCVCVGVAGNKTHLLFLSAPWGLEGLARALQTAMMDKMFSTTLEKSGCYCVRLYTETQNHRIPRTPHALFMCYEKHDSKEKRKTAMLYFHCQLSCEVWRGGRRWERDADGGERRGEWFSSSVQIRSWWWQGSGLRNTPPPPPLHLHPLLPLSPPVTAPLPPLPPIDWLEECVKCPLRGTDSKTVFTRSTLSPLLTACEELLPPPLMCQPNGEELAGSHCIC